MPPMSGSTSKQADRRIQSLEVAEGAPFRLTAYSKNICPVHGELIVDLTVPL